MTDRPILFSGQMVRAILSGAKTETRRVVKPGAGQGKWLTPRLLDQVKRGEMVEGGWQMYHPLAGTIHAGMIISENSPLGWIRLRYGVPGDRLWVRETWKAWATVGAGTEVRVQYRADNATRDLHMDEWDAPRADRWARSIFMPRWASRLALAVESVRVERLHDIDDAGARAEGVADREAYRALWSDINGAESWDANPWVWVVGFSRVQK